MPGKKTTVLRSAGSSTENWRNASAILDRGEWFGNLPPDLKGQILGNSFQRSFRTSEVISAEDHHQTGLWAVLDGQVAITRRVASDNEFFYHLGGPGFWFGEAGLINRTPALVTATARTALCVLFLPVKKFDLIVEKQPSYLRCFAELQGMRYALMLRHLAQCAGLSPERYLRIRLADFSDLIRADVGGSKPVELALSQADVAHMIGTSRQTVSVLLKKLEAAGLIKLSFRKLSILDPTSLRGGHRRTGLQG